MTCYDEALVEIKKQLDWKGPNGTLLRYVVIERALAEQLLTSQYTNQQVTNAQYAEALRKIGGLERRIREQK